MREIIFDIETNDRLEDLTKIHVIGIKVDDEPVRTFGGRTDDAVRSILPLLAEEDVTLIGHNIMDFDLPAIQKIYPAFCPKGKIVDTLLLSRLYWADIKANDFTMLKRMPSFPKKLIGTHGLEAWGWRLGEQKSHYGSAKFVPAEWAEWTQEMQDYCGQDVTVQYRLWQMMKSKGYSQEAIDLEHDFKRCIRIQEAHGFPFDVKAAQTLYAELAATRAELEEKIRPLFPAWEVQTSFVPKRGNKTRGYVAGVPFIKTKTVTFNPRSHEQVGMRLKEQRGWIPEKWTDGGAPQVDEDVLEELAKQGWPECGLLLEHFKVDKIIGLLAEGKNAWLKLERGGVIYGGVITNGAVTGRCAHVKPNLGNIPKKGELGKRCRALFYAPPGMKLVGVDASGLELRLFAHYLATYDGGRYVTVVTTGDVHTTNMTAMGITSRDLAKNGIYCFLYGGGDKKFATTIGIPAENGKVVKAGFIKNTPGLGALRDAVQEAARQRHFLRGLDRRNLHVRSLHAALNTLLQSAGAVIIKKATVLFHRALAERGLLGGAAEAITGNLFYLGRMQDWRVCMVAHVHDELQLLVPEGMEDEVGTLGVECITQAGQHFKLKCPLTGEQKAGGNWKETH
jgi:DNA polymerase I-like protein with 3'-5' exonuclease and polymerase domains